MLDNVRHETHCFGELRVLSAHSFTLRGEWGTTDVVVQFHQGPEWGRTVKWIEFSFGEGYIKTCKELERVENFCRGITENDRFFLSLKGCWRWDAVKIGRELYAAAPSAAETAALAPVFLTHPFPSVLK